jgi:hypothetical protein
MGQRYSKRISKHGDNQKSQSFDSGIFKTILIFTNYFSCINLNSIEAYTIKNKPEIIIFCPVRILLQYALKIEISLKHHQSDK